ncbi:hypothetical protein C9374_004088 [Naegleria lovaniensis]|uniref:Uncharacterized protein n=1 Tax=Naegleria lovaniensis TaxID=51637 RepID=A0AA88KJN2_NAELO|nr:uncharacterized protein C9374_004088 [Naegleria lovaniensis]KAG2383417.1 hypothetical protein C9374_004088 [Naegleria lovaniensis]
MFNRVLSIRWVVTALVHVLMMLVVLNIPVHAASPQPVFTPLETVYKNYLVGNAVQNADFTLTQNLPNASPVQNFNQIYSGSTIQVISSGGAVSGNAVKFVGVNNGLSQGITFNQSTRKVIYYSAWSKAENVGGVQDPSYSFYLDILFMDGSSLFGQTLNFPVGNTSWSMKYAFLIPEKPVKSLSMNILFRGTHSGSAYFSNLIISELSIPYENVQVLDGSVVAKVAYSPSLTSLHTLSTSNGLSLKFSKIDGSLVGLNIDGQTVASDSSAQFGGLFVKDMQVRLNESKIYLPTPTQIITSSNSFRTESTLPELGLVLNTTYKADLDLSKTISIRVDIENTWIQKDRSLTLLVAIPVTNMNLNWMWGDYIRSSRDIVDLNPREYHRMSARVSTNAQLVTSYPFIGMSTNVTSGTNVGLSLAIPLSSPKIIRFAYNSICKLLYASVDIGISPKSGISNKAWFDLILYKHDKLETTIGGVTTTTPYPFRNAAFGYYQRYPQFFTRRIPPEEEGVWIAFSDVSTIPNITDFGFGFHELGADNQINFAKANGIKGLRYVTEPFSSWIRLRNTNVDPNNYTHVIEYLTQQAQNPNSPIKEQAQLTLVSTIKDPDTGLYRCTSIDRPWCPNKCVLCTLCPLPNVKPASHLPSYFVNKAEADWNPTVWGTYNNPASLYYNLSGEFVDSFSSNSYLINYTPEHVKAVNEPYLTFDANRPQYVGIAGIFSTYLFTKTIGEFLHSLPTKKYFMANAAASNSISWGVDLFDTTGTEVGWVTNGQFTPASDESVSFSRTVFGQKPYGYLLNEHYTSLTSSIMLQYFQFCLFYGMYPSSFSEDASTSPFWSIPAAYEPHRALFKQYIPYFRRLNQNGWQILTGVRLLVNGSMIDRVQADSVTVAPPAVRVERFSSLSSTQEVYFTVMVSQSVYNSRITLLFDVDVISNGQLIVQCVAYADPNFASYTEVIVVNMGRAKAVTPPTPNPSPSPIPSPIPSPKPSKPLPKPSKSAKSSINPRASLSREVNEGVAKCYQVGLLFTLLLIGVLIF